MERVIDGFFYGLFMDVEILQKSGAAPVNPRRAYVDGFRLRIADRATLVPESGRRSFGMLIGLTHTELDRLYSTTGLEVYRPEPVLARVIDGPEIAALSYNLPAEPPREQRNANYAARLQSLLRRLDFPAEYIDSLGC
jgi:Gamma-glutamyl cyclotransferase, AIG2-like